MMPAITWKGTATTFLIEERAMHYRFKYLELSKGRIQVSLLVDRW